MLRPLALALAALALLGAGGRAFADPAPVAPRARLDTGVVVGTT